MKNTPLKDVCSTALVDLEKDGQILPNVEYFLLSDVLPEDRQLREGIQQKKLASILFMYKPFIKKVTRPRIPSGAPYRGY